MTPLSPEHPAKLYKSDVRNITKNKSHNYVEDWLNQSIEISVEGNVSIVAPENEFDYQAQEEFSIADASAETQGIITQSEALGGSAETLVHSLAFDNQHHNQTEGESSTPQAEGIITHSEEAVGGLQVSQNVRPCIFQCMQFYSK